MSRENIDRVRKALDRFNRTGLIAVDHLAPDFQMHQASPIDTAGVFHGRDALRDSLHELQESFEDLKFEAERFIQAPSGDVVVLIRVRGRGRGSGAQVDNRTACFEATRPLAWWSTKSKPKPSKPWGCGSSPGEFR